MIFLIRNIFIWTNNVTHSDSATSRQLRRDRGSSLLSMLYAHVSGGCSGARKAAYLTVTTLSRTGSGGFLWCAQVPALAATRAGRQAAGNSTPR